MKKSQIHHVQLDQESVAQPCLVHRDTCEMNASALLNFTPWVGWGPQHLPSQVTGMEHNNQMQAEVLANHRDYGYEFKFHITSNNISWGDCGWVSRTFFLGWRFHKVSRWIQFCAIPQEKWDHSLKAPTKTYAVMWFFLKWQLNQRFQWGPLFD